MPGRHITLAFLPGSTVTALMLIVWALPARAIDNAAIPPDPVVPKPGKKTSSAPPPQSPEKFNPDPPQIPARPLLPEDSYRLEFRKLPSRGAPPQPPRQFNPDPGASIADLSRENSFELAPTFEREPVPGALDLPRENVRRLELLQIEPEVTNRFGLDPLPENLRLPRPQTRINEPVSLKFENGEYPLSFQGAGFPAYSEPVPNRWRIPFTPWRRYTSGSMEMPYSTGGPRLWHPYYQSVLKGDLPVIGQDIFLNLTAETETEFEARRVPTPSGISSARSDSAEFFGRGEQFLLGNNFSFSAELFKGETVFQPVHWAIKIQPVFNINFIDVQETGVVNADPRGTSPHDNFPPPSTGSLTNSTGVRDLLNGQLRPVNDYTGTSRTQRRSSFWALQEYSLEYHLADLSDNYDFIALRAGSQPFSSDFRGFIFNDINLGLRLFGNYDNNKYQYSVAAFDLREKDSNSELNTFDQRDQRIIVANVYRQDFLTKGYTAQFSFHANLDDGETHYDRNHNIARPAPLGTVREHQIDAFYFGWAGDGHIGRWNVNHAFYEVAGRDTFNGVAGRPVNIHAQMGALELSYDRDWVRYKASFFYASGDSSPGNGTATGFDSILDNPNFTGGPFSFFVHQGFNFAGSAVGLKSRSSLLLNLRTSKTEGQANFVNPGSFVYGLGLDMDVTPRLRSFANLNYVRFVATDPLKILLQTDKVDGELGWDLSLGFQYRPLLTDNIVISTGFGAFLPGHGFRDIYRRSTAPVPGFSTHGEPGQPDSFLYSALLALTFTY